MVRYADPNVPRIQSEISQYAVAIVPVRDGMLSAIEQGSGTCIVISGRFFVATAAHVISEFPTTRYCVLSTRRTRDVWKVLNGGIRGGGDYDRLDVGWLELAPAAAKQIDRSFLPLERIRPRCDGIGEDLIVYGAPASDQVLSTAEDGLPSVKAMGGWWASRGLGSDEVGESLDSDAKLYADWPREITGHDGAPYPLPDAPGISGGAVWTLNMRKREEHEWHPSFVQLAAIEYAWVRRGVPRRHLRACQMHTWLQMLVEDLRELAPTIEPFLRAATL